MRPGSDQHNNDAPPTSSNCAGRRASDTDWLEDVVRDGAEQGQFNVGDKRPRDVAAQKVQAGCSGVVALVGKAVVAGKILVLERLRRPNLVRRLVLSPRPPNPFGGLVLGRRPPNPVGGLALARSMREDTFIRTRIDAIIERLVIQLFQWRSEIGLLIAEVVRNWDARTASDRLELVLGSDLQYIRINGTILGALVGCVIYLLSIAVA
jgi:hypothetical protein